jgi:hypothetical protein
VSIKVVPLFKEETVVTDYGKYCSLCQDLGEPPPHDHGVTLKAERKVRIDAGNKTTIQCDKCQREIVEDSPMTTAMRGHLFSLQSRPVFSFCYPVTTPVGKSYFGDDVHLDVLHYHTNCI